MANAEHLKILKEGVEGWNKWRSENPNIKPDLSGSDLSNAKLCDLQFLDFRYRSIISGDSFKAYLENPNLLRINLSYTNLSGANFAKSFLTAGNFKNANLSEANFEMADLVGANLLGSNFEKTNFEEADLSHSVLTGGDLSDTNLSSASFMHANLVNCNLSNNHTLDGSFWGAKLMHSTATEAWFNNAGLQEADLSHAKLNKSVLANSNLSGAILSHADLSDADLYGANLMNCKLIQAKLIGADLTNVDLIRADLSGADISKSMIFGVNVWALKKDGLIQKSLTITPKYEPEITVDDIEVAQFIYLLLNYRKFRDVIQTVTDKVVLILGRFIPERKIVLEAIRDELRKRNFLPILFDFEKPATRDLTETISILAKLSRFVIVDLTDPNSVPHELATLIPVSRSLPFAPIMLKGQKPYPLFQDFSSYGWVLPTFEYESEAHLVENLGGGVIEPAERKVQEIRARSQL